ncbi:EAL domain-containing protein [Cognatiluteimonas weifangensis]|uniref:bifunctional diguanylate cyclase/phosphodiesterase n=1 Tax=Cognatiluteimonas weifangensis TaxID=2303539 RepID=UPI001F3F910D|nr:EAL domain-containing protein [Luteimonas weifangensis]
MRTSPDSDGFAPGLQAAPEVGDAVPLRLPAWLWSLLVLALGLALSYWTADRQRAGVEREQRVELRRLADESQTALVASLHACEMLLRSVQTVFLASEDVSATEFAHIYQALQPRSEFPSLQALAYARRTGEADFVTVMVEPATGNERIFGLSLAAQPANQAAALASRDSNQVAMSAPFRLLQTPTHAGNDGVTMRLPIYSSGPPPATLAARRARMRGSIAASFHVHRLIADALPPAAFERLHLVVDDVTGGRTRQLYVSPGKAPPAATAQDRSVRELHYGGRSWRVTMQPLRSLAAAVDWRESMLWPGLLASVLLALLVWSVATTRRRALELGWRMSHRYRESEQRFRTLNDLLPALVLLARVDDGRILYANEAARVRLGEHIEDGTALATLFEEESLRKRLAERDDDTPWNNVEAVLVSLGGDRFWATTSVAQVRVGDDQRMLMVASDISEQRQLTELLSYQASHDTLTELYNRREFERHVQRALHAVAHGAPACALLYIDLDQFKLINDTSGHLAGDQLLSQLALAMAEQLRGGDILARLGGDEFGILAHDARPEGALVLAERLRARIEGHIYVWEQRSYTISASVGVVMIDRGGMTLREVLSQADTACYMAKDHGRNRVHFFSEQDDETIRRRGEMEWANRLRWVIDEQRLLLDYQEVRPLQPRPQQDPHIELLLRLRDEDGRVVMPGAFLPAAERYGLIAQLDRWVVAEATAHFGQLHADGRTPGRCSLNLSGATLEDDSLADYVLGLIERHGVAPERLCFEITETEAVRNLPRAVRFFERVRAIGCQVSLDDFGAGMSSFGYLKNLPVDVIKIDGSFIRDLDNDPMSRSIVDAISEIGHQRGLDVVAEWVASDAIADILRQLGVDYGQGFALHRPEPVRYQRVLRGQPAR